LVKAYILESTGSYDKLVRKTLRLKDLQAGEVRIKHTAIAINTIDAEYRKGIFQAPLPAILGFAAIGYIEEISGNVGDYKIGDRVGYLSRRMGAYSEKRNIHYKELVTIPQNVADKDAAVLVFKGIMAYYLVSRIFIIQPNMKVLIHGAAGSLGMLVTNLAKLAGGTVIGTVGSDFKKEIALKNGCNHVVDYSLTSYETTLTELCASDKINVVYDFVGRDTFSSTVNFMSEYSLMVCAGSASGIVDKFNLESLREKNIFVVSPNIFQYKHEFEFKLAVAEVFELFSKKIISSNVTQEYSFEEIPAAHHNLENRHKYGNSVALL
jgi:NADPH2:quinone reductase